MRSVINLSRILQAFLVVVLVAVIAVMALTVSGRTGIVQRRNNYRRAQLTTIMGSVGQFIANRRNLLPAEITTTPQQIGIATDGCTVHNSSCQVDAVRCTKLHIATGDPKAQTLPADVLYGNAARTYFVVQLVKPNTILLTACGAENGAKISLQKTFPNLRITPTPAEADYDAKFATSSAARISNDY
jgi:hypothetical protein